MFRAVFALVSLGLATAIAQPAPATDLTAILAKTAAREERIAKLHERCEFGIVRTTESLNAKGAITSTIVVTTLEQHDGTQHLSTILRESKDGRDQAVRSVAAPRHDNFIMPNPFTAIEQDAFTFRDRGPDPTGSGWTRIAFEPRDRDRAGAGQGTALIDPQDGAIRRLDFTPSHPGTFTRHLVLRAEFDAETPEGPGLSRLDADGDGGALFFYKRVRVAAIFTDYRFPSSPAR